MATTHDAKGGRTIELLIPFEHLGKKYEAIHFKPIMFDHLLRWQHGDFPSSLALMSALSGESEMTLRMLRYPDADRVMAAMFDMLPEPIRNDIVNGQVPRAAAPPVAAEFQSEAIEEVSEPFKLDDAAE